MMDCYLPQTIYFQCGHEGQATWQGDGFRYGMAVEKLGETIKQTQDKADRMVCDDCFEE